MDWQVMQTEKTTQKKSQQSTSAPETNNDPAITDEKQSDSPDQDDFSYKTQDFSFTRELFNIAIN